MKIKASSLESQPEPHHQQGRDLQLDLERVTHLIPVVSKEQPKEWQCPQEFPSPGSPPEPLQGPGPTTQTGNTPDPAQPLHQALSTECVEDTSRFPNFFDGQV